MINVTAEVLHIRSQNSSNASEEERLPAELPPVAVPLGVTGERGVSGLGSRV